MIPLAAFTVVMAAFLGSVAFAIQQEANLEGTAGNFSDLQGDQLSPPVDDINSADR